MKPFSLTLLALLALSPSLGAFGGSGPWANATYYPGNLDGKYQAAVSGVNTSGVLGFAIRDGAPPFLQSQTESLSETALISDTVAVNQLIEIDRSLNYYAIFVNGRSYIGTTAAAVNYDSKKVNGTLIGSAPATITNTNQQISSQLLFPDLPPGVSTQLITNTTITNETISTVVDGILTTTNISFTNVSVATIEITNSQFFTNDVLNPVVISTGVDGSFDARIRGRGSVFTFKGPGQLSAPGAITAGQQANHVFPFTVDGIRVSFSSQSSFQNLNQSGASAGGGSGSQ